MPFQISGFEIGDRFISLPERRKINANRITVVVGPNGVGKTNLLVEMVYHFTGKNRSSRRESQSFVRIESVGGRAPARVVTQTFSPFSRFPKERSRALGLRDYLIDGDEQYATIGFTRGIGFQGSVSRVAVGRIIRKIFTRPEHARPLAKAMESLGFNPLLTLGFQTVQAFVGSDIRNKKELRVSITEYISVIKAKSSHSFDEQKLVREFQNESDAALALRIEKSLLTLQQVSVEKRSAGNVKRNEYVFEVSLLEPERNADLLESVLTLNRLGLLRISSCLLTPHGKNGSWLSGYGIAPGEIDIADASSGQQQLLSSLFGVVAEADDNSLILIDEPELSLHPAWQTQFIDLLTDALSGIRKCHIFIATHSALVAQRAHELDLEIISLGSESLKLSPKENNAVSVDQMLLETFGLAVRDSAYVSKLLLELIMDADESPELRAEARKKISAIKKIYGNASIEDKVMKRLIQSASKLIG